MTNIMIKRLMKAQEFDRAVELQKVYWGNDASNLVPRNVLHSICHHGGHLLGAFDGSRLVGFVLGFLGTAVDADAPDAERAASNLLIMSKRMLVLPGYRGRNLGLKLKLAQRDIALKQGIDLVSWTFDPLLAINAHLNLRKLGAISGRFAVNYFDHSDPESLWADRLIVHWWVRGKRAQNCAAGHTSRRTLKQCLEANTPIVNRLGESGPAIAPRALSQLPDSDSVLVEIPSDIRQLDEHVPALARCWRSHIRALLPLLLDAGYFVSDFVSADAGGQRRTYYYLGRHDDSA